MRFIVDQARLTQTSNRLLERFVDRVSHFEMFMELNEAILDMTGSEYGFVARVFRNEKGPFIKTVARSTHQREPSKTHTAHSDTPQCNATAPESQSRPDPASSDLTR